MFFYKYIYHPEATVNPALLWEYDYSTFDWDKMRQKVVERVVERGDYSDWYAILNKYGVEGVVECIKRIPSLDNYDANFVSNVFQINKKDMLCYKSRPFLQGHWNS